MHVHAVAVTVTEALVLRPLLEDHITESICIPVPVDRIKQKCFQITTKKIKSITVSRKVFWPIKAPFCVADRSCRPVCHSAKLYSIVLRSKRRATWTTCLEWEMFTIMRNNKSLHESVFSERELKFTFAICRRPSVCLSSDVCLSVTFVRPTQAIEIFGTFSSPFGTLAIC